MLLCFSGFLEHLRDNLLEEPLEAESLFSGFLSCRCDIAGSCHAINGAHVLAVTSVGTIAVIC